MDASQNEKPEGQKDNKEKMCGVMLALRNANTAIYVFYLYHYLGVDLDLSFNLITKRMKLTRWA